jgi:hypothetical protein
MSYTKAPIDHSEFGGGDGIVDPEVRKDRVLSSAQERMEIMFTDPTDPEADPAVVDLTAVPAPAPTRAVDPATAVGTSQ